MDPPVVYLPPEEAGIEPSATPKGSALLVDDDEWVRLSTRAQLEARGWQVVEAEDGATALRLFNADPQPFRFVLLDIKLPGMESADVARGLRAARADIPILVYSGYARWMVDPVLLSPPNTGFLAKPFGAEELQEELGRLGVEL